MSGHGRGTIPSPNIWGTPEVYELENLASDQAGLIDATIGSLRSWAGARVLDIGCGSGFHLPHFASYSAQPIGVEPHLPLLALAGERLRDSGIPVLAGSAEALPLADGSVDVVHARWAYFFGPGCEPGLAEVERVIRPGGLAVFVDNDPTSESTFSRWFEAAYPAYDGSGVERFWRRHGFATERLTIEWTFDTRKDLDAVVGIEFPPDAAARFLHELPPGQLSVDYAVALRWRRKTTSA